jgi:hypothetical protein
MTPEAVIGLSGASLLIAAAGCLALQRLRLAPRWRVLALTALLLACAAPVRGLPLAGYLRGIVGDPSISTMLLAGAGLASFVLGRDLVGARERAAWLAAAAAAALFLYPMALGAGAFDPYALGFGSYGFVTALLALTLVAWGTRRYWLVSSIVAAVVAHLAGLLESANLWDYLVDPLIAAYAAFWWLRQAARAAFVRLRPAS